MMNSIDIDTVLILMIIISVGLMFLGFYLKNRKGSSYRSGVLFFLSGMIFLGLLNFLGEYIENATITAIVVVTTIITAMILIYIANSFLFPEKDNL